MSNALLIVSKEQYSSNKTRLALKIASKIREKGNSTTVFLVEDGVYLATDNKVEELIEAGITVKAEEWDLKARGLKGRINSKVEIKTSEDLLTEISDRNETVLWF